MLIRIVRVGFEAGKGQALYRLTRAGIPPTTAASFDGEAHFRVRRGVRPQTADNCEIIVMRGEPTCYVQVPFAPIQPLGSSPTFVGPDPAVYRRRVALLLANMAMSAELERAALVPHLVMASQR
jgi:hypothetical protein